MRACGRGRLPEVLRRITCSCYIKKKKSLFFKFLIIKLIILSIENLESTEMHSYAYIYPKGCNVYNKKGRSLYTCMYFLVFLSNEESISLISLNIVLAGRPTCRLHAAQDGCECGPTQNHKFT